MTEVITSPKAGFCFGVKKAIDLAVSAAKGAEKDENGNCGIYTCGMLIHNKRVEKDLADLGIGRVDDLAEAPAGARIIVRSHGEPKRFYDKAEELGL